MNRPQHPEIVLVAFGTSDPEARMVFDYIDAKVREGFPEHTVSWAFTSSIIRAKLAKQGVVTRSPAEAVADLKRRGVVQAVFQSLHVMPGQEFNEITSLDTAGLQIAVGDALLTTDQDITAVITALGKDIDAAAATVLAAHGNERYPAFNRQLLQFADRLRVQYPEVVVCSVEGQPGTAPLQQARARAQETGRVHFVPLMVVAGDHIMNDVMGSEPDSWKNIIGAKQSTCARPLGYNDAVLTVFRQHLAAALQKFEGR